MANFFYYDGNNANHMLDVLAQHQCDKGLPGHHVDVFSDFNAAERALHEKQYAAVVTTTGRSANRPSGLELQDIARQICPATPRLVVSEGQDSVWLAGKLAERYKSNENLPVPFNRVSRRVVDNFQLVILPYMASLAAKPARPTVAVPTASGPAPAPGAKS